MPSLPPPRHIPTLPNAVSCWPCRESLLRGGQELFRIRSWTTENGWIGNIQTAAIRQYPEKRGSTVAFRLHKGRVNLRLIASQASCHAARNSRKSPQFPSAGLLNRPRQPQSPAFPRTRLRLCERAHAGVPQGGEGFFAEMRAINGTAVYLPAVQTEAHQR